MTAKRSPLNSLPSAATPWMRNFRCAIDSHPLGRHFRQEIGSRPPGGLISDEKSDESELRGHISGGKSDESKLRGHFSGGKSDESELRGHFSSGKSDESELRGHFSSEKLALHPLEMTFPARNRPQPPRSEILGEKSALHP